MNRLLIPLVMTAALIAAVPRAALAQHEGHQAPGQTAGGQAADPAQLAACGESLRHAGTLIDAANARFEAARQTNQPSALRSAIDDLQTTLSSIRTQLATCNQLQAAAGHNMATMPAPSPASPSPEPATPSTSPTTSPKMVMVMTALDPTKLKCQSKIDPKTAAKTTYKGKTYYFCSEKERDEFLTDPDMSLSMRPPV